MTIGVLPSSSSPASDLPALPADDGDYALRVSGGVGSWVRNPVFTSVGVTDDTNTIVLDNDPLDATRLFIDKATRVFASVLTNDFYAAGGGLTIIDDNGDQHRAVFLDDYTTPTQLWLGDNNETALATRWQGNGLVMKSGANPVGSTDPGALIVSLDSYVYGTLGDDFDLTADGNWHLATQTGPVFGMIQSSKAINIDAGTTGPVTIQGGSVNVEGHDVSHFTSTSILNLSGEAQINVQTDGGLGLSAGAQITVTENAVVPWEIWAGSGSPEGVVTAPKGSTYQDVTNGQEYIKNTGSGNTGWKQVTHA